MKNAGIPGRYAFGTQSKHQSYPLQLLNSATLVPEVLIFLLIYSSILRREKTNLKDVPGKLLSLIHKDTSKTEDLLSLNRLSL